MITNVHDEPERNEIFAYRAWGYIQTEGDDLPSLPLPAERVRVSPAACLLLLGLAYFLWRIYQ